VAINTAVAQVLVEFAKVISNSEDFDEAIPALLKQSFDEAYKILYDGNCYNPIWVKEAYTRRLLSFHSAIDTIQCLSDDNATTLFTSLGVFRQSEMQSRAKVALEGYVDALCLELATMITAGKQYLIDPAIQYLTEIKATHTCDAGNIFTQASHILLPTAQKLSDSLLSWEGVSCEVSNLIDQLSAWRTLELPTLIEFTKSGKKALIKGREILNQLEIILPKRLRNYSDFDDILFHEE
jgi:glutamine synthetase